MSDQPSNLCALPWSSLSVSPDGSCRVCCIAEDTIKDSSGKTLYAQTSSIKEIFHAKTMVDLRDQMRRNEKPKMCNHCWKDEAVGMTSKRQREPFYAIDDTEYWKKEPDNIIEIQVIMNNTCNLKCRSCGPDHSSMWRKELRDLKRPYPLFQLGQPGDFTGRLWLDREEWTRDLVRLEIVGGEPFLTEQWKILWNELMDSGKANDLFLSMSTNGTQFPEELITRMSNEFKFFGAGLSIDGVGSVYEYIRHPGVWNETYSNLKKFHDLEKASLTINYTIGWANALDLPNMHRLIKTDFPKFKVWHNIIHGPEHMALWAIPTPLKRHIEETLRDLPWNEVSLIQGDYAGIVGFMNSREITDDQFMRNLSIFKTHDKYRNEDLLTSIPDLAPFILPYWNRL